MAFPKVNINVTNGNLQRSIAVEDAVPALVATVNGDTLAGVVNKVYNLADAEDKGYTEEAEPFMHGLIEEFYTETGGNTLLYLYGTDAEQTMEDVLDSTNAYGLTRLLNAGGGEINLVAIARKPAEGYDAGDGFTDKDVENAVLVSKSLCEAQQKQNTPLRIFIEGRVANTDAENSFKPSEAGNGYVGVVLGGTKADGSGAVSLALARAVKYKAHVKLGNGQNGALTATQIYIGADRYEDRLDMETLHDAGYLTFQRRAGSAGYYFGRDNMCSSDDYRILAHGRIMDKAQRIAAEAYHPFIETSIALEPNGRIKQSEASYMETVLDSALRTGMAEQISDVSVSVDTEQDIVNTSTLAVTVKVLPLGYMTWITVTLGLAAATEQ